MRLGKAIISEEGQTLLGHQIELTQGLINKLIQMGDQELYIEDRRTDDIYIEDFVIMPQESRCRMLTTHDKPETIPCLDASGPCT